MNGPQHYDMAESLIERASAHTTGTGAHSATLAEAQVHATLALVAVTAELASHSAPPLVRRDDSHDWASVLGDPSWESRF